MAEVRDLDVLRHAERFVKLGGEKIDVSFVPSAITFALQAVLAETGKLDQKKLGKSDNDEIAKAFDLQVQLCAIFCEHEHPDMTREWFDSHTNAEQVTGLSEEIQKAYTNAYEGIDPN